MFRFRYRIQRVFVFLCLPLYSNSDPFQSCASFSLGFFYLILQRVRPLIYSTDIACKPEHSARNVDPAVSVGLLQTPQIHSLFQRTILNWDTNIHSTIMEQSSISFFDKSQISSFYKNIKPWKWDFWWQEGVSNLSFSTVTVTQASFSVLDKQLLILYLFLTKFH